MGKGFQRPPIPRRCQPAWWNAALLPQEWTAFHLRHHTAAPSLPLGRCCILSAGCPAGLPRSFQGPCVLRGDEKREAGVVWIGLGTALLVPSTEGPLESPWED